MRRFLPKSLVGQIAAVMALALLVAQGINFSLILTERQRLSFAQIEGPAITRFVLAAQRLAEAPGEEPAPPFPRRGRFSVDSASLVPDGRRDPRIERRLREAAAAAGLPLIEARAMVSEGAPWRRMAERLPAAERERIEARRGGRLQTLILSARLQDGRWINGRMVTARHDPWVAPRLAGSTLLIYLIVLGAMVWMAARITRPLRDLTAAAQSFQGRGEAPRVEPRGPADLRRAVEAFNAMGARVSAMLDEKDRMLGAIGHDLRTPLASLRIRAESVRPEKESVKMIATIEEMTAMLDDTLTLARSGRSREPLRSVDLCALADSVVEEFRALGAEVAMEESPRQVARIRPSLIRRAVRNLIENGVKYGGSVEVTVAEAGACAAIEVRDRGPGIAEDELANVKEPFYRLEASRSRETGGTGLGLALARAAALAHGGELELENRTEGGLVARILLPREP